MTVISGVSERWDDGVQVNKGKLGITFLVSGSRCTSSSSALFLGVLLETLLCYC